MFRHIVAVLSLGVASASIAAPVTYEFEGYLTRREMMEQSPQLSSFQPGAHFTGTIEIDRDRRNWDWESGAYWYDPVVSWTVTVAGQTVHSSIVDDGTFQYTQTAWGGTDDEPSLHIEGPGPESDIALDWTSLVAPDSATKNQYDALRPNNWSIEVYSNTPDCAACTSEFDGVVTGLWRQGQAHTTYTQSFDSATRPQWMNVLGRWNVANGTLSNVDNVTFTASVYTGMSLPESYEITSRMYSAWSARGNTLGLVFNYLDPKNFDEVRFNSLGLATLTHVHDGVREALATTSYAAAKHTWFDVRVQREQARVKVSAGGQQVFDVDAGTFRGGYAGVFASWNKASFDDFTISSGAGWNAKRYSFDSGISGWTVEKGEWAASNGYFRNSSNLVASIATAPPIPASEYSISASMYLEWSAYGNRGGFVYDYQDAKNYRGILVSSAKPYQTDTSSGVTRGTIEVFEVKNGVRNVVRTMSTTLRAHEWDPIRVVRLGDTTKVRVGDEYSIQQYSIPQSQVTGAKRVGLLASWNLVRFDDVVIANHQ